MANPQSTILQHYNALCKKSRDNNGRSCPIVNLRLHHAWITSYLIQRFTKGGEHVLDLACGKGGDLVKWESAKVKSYVGVDLVECLLEEAKRRYTTNKCTFAAQFSCKDGFGSTLLQELGLENQGNNKSFPFKESVLKNKGHCESSLVKDANSKQGHHEKFPFQQNKLQNHGHQIPLVSQDLRYMFLSSYDTILFQKLSLKTLSQYHEDFFILESCMSNQDYIDSKLMVLELESTKNGLVHDYCMKSSSKQNLNTNKAMRKNNCVRRMLRLTLEKSSGSLIDQPCLGFTNDIHHETLMHYVEKIKSKKQNHSSLGYQTNMEMKQVKGVRKNLNNVIGNVKEFVNNNLQRSLKNVHDNESLATMVGRQGDDLDKRMIGQHFDVCSCQFALHYAWSSEERARGAIRNVSMALNNGGYFIGTIPDAQVVLKRLQEVAITNGSCLQEVNQDCEDLHFGNKLYNVKFDVANGAKALSLAKEIEINELNKQDFTMAEAVNLQAFQEKEKIRRSHLTPTTNMFPKLAECFGIEYEFHLEGAVEHCPEWLVPLHSLVSLANQYGLELVFAINFEALLSTQLQQPNVFSFGSPLSHSSPSTNELECMSLYLAFAFQKQAI